MQLFSLTTSGSYKRRCIDLRQDHDILWAPWYWDDAEPDLWPHRRLHQVGQIVLMHIADWFYVYSFSLSLSTLHTYAHSQMHTHHSSLLTHSAIQADVIAFTAQLTWVSSSHYNKKSTFRTVCCSIAVSTVDPNALEQTLEGDCGHICVSTANVENATIKINFARKTIFTNTSRLYSYVRKFVLNLPCYWDRELFKFDCPLGITQEPSEYVCN